MVQDGPEMVPGWARDGPEMGPRLRWPRTQVKPSPMADLKKELASVEASAAYGFLDQDQLAERCPGASGVPRQGPQDRTERA